MDGVGSGDRHGLAARAAHSLALGAAAGDGGQALEDQLRVGHGLAPDLEQGVLHAARAVRREQDAFDPPDRVVGTSKTFRSLARVAGAAPRDEGPYVARSLSHADVTAWVPRLAGMDRSARAGLPGVSPDRAGQLLGGALVAEAALDLLAVDALTIGPWALREGIILRRLDHLA